MLLYDSLSNLINSKGFVILISDEYDPTFGPALIDKGLTPYRNPVVAEDNEVDYSYQEMEEYDDESLCELERIEQVDMNKSFPFMSSTYSKQSVKVETTVTITHIVDICTNLDLDFKFKNPEDVIEVYETLNEYISHASNHQHYSMASTEAKSYVSKCKEALTVLSPAYKSNINKLKLQGRVTKAPTLEDVLNQLYSSKGR